jgi:hypothetical protein
MSWKTYAWTVEELHAFFILALDGSEWSASRLDRFTLREGPPVAIEQEVGCSPATVQKCQRVQSRV